MQGISVARFKSQFNALILGFAVLTTTSCDARTTSSSRVKVEQAALPIRYSVALPVTIAEMNLWANGSLNFPPQSHVVDNLSFGQPAMFHRLETASQSVSKEERVAWSNRWYNLLEFRTTSPEFCGLAKPVIQGPESTIRMAIVASYVRDCYKPDDRSSILRQDTPNRTIVDFFDIYKGPVSKGVAVPYDVRLEAAAADLIGNGSDLEARSAAFALIEQKTPQAETALLSIYQRLQEGERKDEVARAFLRGESAEAKRIGQEFCSRKKTDTMCSNSDPLAGFEPGKDPPKPSIAAIQASKDRLISMGFQRVSTLGPAATATESSEVLLLEAGYGYDFDVETDSFPNGHDSLLRNLARLTNPGLDAAVFEEVPPSNDEGPYELRAYLNGKRYRIAAKNLGDWYDVAAVLALLDYMLVDQKAHYKLVVLPTEDQRLTVIGGPSPAIDLALKANLIRRGDVGRAEQLGKGFENEVMKKLREK